jgi:pimeloyl-ACP methyl ester carboxylesterase
MADHFAPDGARLHYTDEGHGLALICLPGLTRNGRDFDYLAPHLPPLRLIRPDYRGRGESDWTGAETYTIAQEAADVLALLDHLRLDDAALLGTSRGGLVGMYLAATAPERLRGLCLNDVGPEIDPAGLERISDYIGRNPAARSHAAAAVALEHTMAGVRERPRRPLAGGGAQAFRRHRAGAGDQLRPGPAQAFLKEFEDGQPDLWPMFDACAGLPLALIRGASSDLLSAATAEEMQRRRPDMIHRGGARARPCAVSRRAGKPARHSPVPGALPVTSLAMIEAAAERLAGRARRTPLLGSPFLDEIAGRRVLVKPECLQHTGSFKFRGAWSAISALPDAQRARGVLAYSSGNHAQGVAYAAKLHRIPALIVMPADAPRLKIANTRALGGEVVLYDRASESREEIGARLAEERGLTLIRPYDEPQVIAGQGTCGLEIAQQAAEAGVSRPTCWYAAAAAG